MDRLLVQGLTSLFPQFPYLLALFFWAQLWSDLVSRVAAKPPETPSRVTEYDLKAPPVLGAFLFARTFLFKIL
jgi:hypothetical protein